ncbi:hypothetical protein ACQJBY_008601 [Aegilops geniculata]
MIVMFLQAFAAMQKLSQSAIVVQRQMWFIEPIQHGGALCNLVSTCGQSIISWLATSALFPLRTIDGERLSEARQSVRVIATGCALPTPTRSRGWPCSSRRGASSRCRQEEAKRSDGRRQSIQAWAIDASWWCLDLGVQWSSMNFSPL